MALSPSEQELLTRNVAAVRLRMDSAARRVGRAPQDVSLLPVTKSMGPEVAAALMELGLKDHGENRPERLPHLALHFPSLARPHWHLIGHIQSRKIRDSLPYVSAVHSVHATELMDRLNERAAALGRSLPIFLQVMVVDETRKQGFAPSELGPALHFARTCAHLQVLGLMAMAPLGSDQTVQRHTFSELRRLREAHASAEVPLAQLSMGMSEDFEIAIEEGATVVRVGSALFEGLQRP